MPRPRSLRLIVSLTLSYAMVFLVPVVAMVLYYSPLTNRIITQKQEDWTAHAVDQARQTLDELLAEVYDLPGALLANQDLHLGPRAEAWDRWRTARELRKHARANAFVYETFLYLHRDGYVYQLNGAAAPATSVFQAESGYSYPALAPAQVLALLDHPRGVVVRAAEPMVVPEKNPLRMVSFFLPVPLNSQHPVGTLVVLVRETALLSLLQPIADRTGGRVVITDRDGRTIVGTEDVLGRGTEVVGLSQVSQVNGWSLRESHPRWSSLGEIAEIQAATVLISLVVVGIAAVLVAGAVWFHYRPIRLLAQVARDALEGSPGPDKNELETIAGTLDTLGHATVHVRRDLVARLVSGQFPTREAFEAAARPFGLHLDHPGLAVALAALGPRDTSPFDAQREFHRGDEFYDLWAVEEPGSRDWILVLCFEPEVSPVTLVRDLWESWPGAPDSTWVIGLGTEAATTAGLSTSLAAARAAADRLFLDQSPRVGGPWEPTWRSVSYPAELIQALEHAVRSVDLGLIQGTVEALIDLLLRPALGPALTLALFVNLQELLRTGVGYRGALGAGARPPAPGPIVHRWTRAELGAEVRRELAGLVQRVNDTRGTQADGERKKILEHIEAVASQGWDGLTLKELAGTFGMAEPAFSRYFRRTIGVGFKEFLEGYRIEVSKRLLVESEDAVETVGHRLGYAASNSSSFIRSFKRSVGMTPGQYRHRFKHDFVQGAQP